MSKHVSRTHRDAFRRLSETGLSFPEAVERLAGEAGVELPKWSPDDEAHEYLQSRDFGVLAARS